MHLYVQNKKSIQFIFLVFDSRQLKLIVIENLLKYKMLKKSFEMYYSVTYHIYKEIDNISIVGTCITVGVKFN